MPVKSAIMIIAAGKPCQGQFRPLQNSQPFLGTTGEVETVDEYKVELVVSDALIKAVIAGMKQAHPYEEPAFDVWQLAEL